mmetsp:Transcript_38415/g.86582  ORF Transcript_38415/g.86582 Transcript_38415/m.86582 type:complete len:284 (+) Transcript_38415:97-948(+)
MGKITEMREKNPPGGSNFGGHFSNAAFGVHMFPGGGDSGGKTAFKGRLDSSEQRHMMSAPGAMHAASVAYTKYAEAGRPNRLRAQYDEHARKASVKDASLKASASAPSVGASADGWEFHAGSVRLGSAAGGMNGTIGSMTGSMGQLRPATGGSVGTSRPSSSASMGSAVAGQSAMEAQMAASLTMNTRWYPHSSTARGTLKLTQPKALLLGVDPIKDKAHECSFFEADKHRFSSITKLPNARPRTPTKSLRWRSNEAWDNPDNHFTMKVTQSVGRSLRPTSQG